MALRPGAQILCSYTIQYDLLFPFFPLIIKSLLALSWKLKNSFNKIHYDCVLIWIFVTYNVRQLITFLFFMFILERKSFLLLQL